MKAQFSFKPLSRWSVFFIITGIGISGAMSTYTVLNVGSGSQTPSLKLSVKATTIKAVAALGHLEPQGEVIQLSAPPSPEGARVQQLLVKQGARVSPGQIIAILDNRDRLQAALQQVQEQVYAAQSRLEQVKTGAKLGEIQAQTAKYRGSQAELTGQIAIQRATIADLEAQLQGEKLSQQVTIERLKEELSNAKIECQRYQSLYEDGAVSAQSRDSNCLKEKISRKLLTEAQANLQRISASGREQILQAHANLQRTILTQQQQIEEESASLMAVTEVRPIDVQVAKADLAVAKVAVVQAKAELDLAYVRTPKAGQILKIHTWPGEIVGDKGVVELGQTGQMYVTAQVYETDISRVRRGQPATITGDQSLGVLQGTVDDIGLQIGRKDVLGTDPVADADARVVEVKIRLTPQDSQKVAGLTNLRVNVVINQLI